MIKKVLPAFIVLASGLAMTSCKKDTETVYQPYTVPTTYKFDNVEYSEATARVNMWAGYTAYLGKSTSRQLSQDTTNYLWNNTNSAFNADNSSNLSSTPAALNALSFNLAGKTADAATIKAYSDSMVKVSQFYNATAAPGIAGKVGSRLVNYSGLEFNQAVAKGLMGSLFLTQIYTYLDKTVSDDNTLSATAASAMQHDWDMAFGYLGIPVNYDTSVTYASTNTARPLALGGYLKERGTYIKAGGIVFDAFIKGRAAIGAKDYATRDAAIVTIKDILERTLAAAAYAYTGLPQGSSDRATQFHALSEGFGFVLALKYRPANSKLTEANYQTLLGIIKTNFYELTADAANTKLKQAQTILSAAYGQLQAS